MRVHRIIGICALAAVTAFFGASAVALAATPSPHLLFSDEFGGALDSATWATLTPWYTNYASGELQYYDSANVTVSGGRLHLASMESSADGSTFTSGIVTSLPRAQFSYGYFEIRAKVPEGRGIFPAFWLTNDDTLEIDAMEVLGDHPDREYMTLHVNGDQVFQQAHNGPDLAAGYHTFGVDWQPTYVRWYVDGVRRASYVHTMSADPLWICLNTAIGGPWAGSPDGSTHFPQSYDVDYVRVWDRRPTPAAKASSGTSADQSANSATASRPATATRTASATASQGAGSASAQVASQTAAEATQTSPAASPETATGGAASDAAQAPPMRISPSTEAVQTVPVDLGTSLPSLSVGPDVRPFASGTEAK